MNGVFFVEVTNWLVGIGGSVFVSGVAYWKRALTAYGALAAVLVGTILYAWGHLAWFGTLLAFFISSSLLTRWKQQKKTILESGYEKTGQRDAGQVFANGGAALALCIANHLYPHPDWWIGYVGVMAAVNGDTWATEIGGLSKTPPRSIITGKEVPKGTSGGVSFLGLLATLFGSLFIGGVAWGLHLITRQPGSPFSALSVSWFSFIIGTTLAGTVGSLADSYMGARWQVMYRCTVCGKEIERPIHCNQKASRIRGWRFMNNDRVNFLSSLIGGITLLLLL